MCTNFAFYYPITTQKVDITRKNGIRYDHVTDLLITGIGNVIEGSGDLLPIKDRYSIHIDMIKYEGTDIYPIQEVLDSIENIESACFHHVHRMFVQYESNYRIPNSSKEPLLAKVINLGMNRKVNCN